MNFPPGGTAIVQALFDQYHHLAIGTDDDRRMLTQMMAATLAARLDSHWGVKKAGPTNPQSKDTLAFSFGDGSFAAWDWQNGTTKAVQIADGQAPTYPRIANQVFIPVEPLDFLSHVDPPATPAPPAPPTPGPQPILPLDAIHELTAALEDLQEVVSSLELKLTEIQKSGFRVHL